MLTLFDTKAETLFLMDFFSGLIFFLMGFLILLQFFQYYRQSDFTLIKSLWLLAVFGILHGFANWTILYQKMFKLENINFIIVFAIIISFVCLYYFAGELLANTFNNKQYAIVLRIIGTVLVLIWSFPLLFGISFLGGGNQIDVYIVWGRFVIGFPAALLTALALNCQIKELERLPAKMWVCSQFGAIISFLTYALSSAAVLNSDFFWKLIYWLSLSFVFEKYPFLLYLLRTASGLGMGYFIMSILRIFNLEEQKRLEEIKQRELVLKSRIQIGRDLHDGLIQSLYGIGLLLEMSLRKEQGGTDHLLSTIKKALIQLEKTTEDARDYIKQLHLPHAILSPAANDFTQIIDNFREYSGIDVEIVYEIPQVICNEIIRNSELLLVVSEALQNVLKHAGASKVKITFAREENFFRLVVRDNGTWKGNTNGKEGFGLASMSGRTKKMGGDFQLNNFKDGTEVRISLPLGGNENVG